VFALERQRNLEHLPGKDTACEQELVIYSNAIERSVQEPGIDLYFGGFFGLELIGIFRWATKRQAIAKEHPLQTDDATITKLCMIVPRTIFPRTGSP
jgi:hypothetical protein